MMVDEHGIQTFRVVDVVLLILSLLFDVLSPQVHIPYYFWAISFSKYTPCQFWEEDMYVVMDVCVGDMYYEGKEGFVVV
jgi:NADH:ubiquinone oxidoreductase subunit 3 (subunit A)